MDKRTRNDKKYSSMDGLLAGGPRRSKPSRYFSDHHPNSNYVNPQRIRQLDDFSGPDGFKAQNNPKLDNAGSFHQRLVNDNTTQKTIPTFNTSIDLSTRRGIKNKKHSKRRLPVWRGNKLKRAVIFSAILAITITGAVFGKIWWEAHKTLQGGGSALALSKEVDPNSLTGEGDGRVNMLLMGTCGDCSDGPWLTDSIMIASLDPINDGVVLLSVPRDLWVKPDGLWPMKINAVYKSARDQYLYQNPNKSKEAESIGINAIEEIIEKYLAVKINYYAMIDFKVFEESVNTVGGITVNLKEDYYDPNMLIGGKYLSLKAGPNELDGGHALGLARSRYGSERGDFDRGQFQQMVLVALKDKVLSLGTFSNPLKVNQLLTSFGNRVSTNFSLDDIMRLYDISKKIPNENINNIDLAMEGEAVVTTGTIGGQSVVYPLAGVDSYDEVQKYIRLKLKDGFIIKENPSIIVLNASGKTGIATKRADELKSYGYNVIQVADAATTDIEFTQLVDNNNGDKKYTKRYLELRFRTQAVNSVDGLDLSPYLADYIVVIGKNG